MTKKEIIWREILFQAMEKRTLNFTQKALAVKYGFSLSTVFNALKAPRAISAVKGRRGFAVTDIEKFLHLWATHRRLTKDVMYQTHVPKSVRTIENELPPRTIFGAFSAVRKKYHGPPPADYDKVYVYLPPGQLAELKKRFPPRKGYQNLIVLKADPWLAQFGHFPPDGQTFADLWNLPNWYAKDFLNDLKDKIFV